MLVIEQHGRCFRVADPSWTDPLDTSYAAAIGGRWNPPGLGALYLNQTREAALANARRSVFERWGVTFDDLRSDALPDLQHVDVTPGGRFADALTAVGIAQLGLAASYPVDIPHPPCQGIGAAAHRAGLDGVAPLSAVAPTQAELVIFADAVTRLVVKRERVPYPW
jgi:hypothetical protein